MSALQASTYDQTEYFYDMLDQLLVIGRAAGGDALTDATLIAGLIATRKAQQSNERLSA